MGIIKKTLGNRGVMALIIVMNVLLVERAFSKEYTLSVYAVEDLNGRDVETVENHLLEQAKNDFSHKLLKPYLYTKLESLGLGHVKEAVLAAYIGQLSSFDVLLKRETEQKTLEIGVEGVVETAHFIDYLNKEVARREGERRVNVWVNVAAGSAVKKSPLFERFKLLVKETFQYKGLNVSFRKSKSRSYIADIAVNLKGSVKRNEVHGVGLSVDEIKFNSHWPIGGEVSLLSSVQTISGVGLLKSDSGGDFIFNIVRPYFEELADILAEKNRDYRLEETRLKLKLQGSKRSIEQFYAWIDQASIGINSVAVLEAGTANNESIVWINYHGTSLDFISELALHDRAMPLSYKVGGVESHVINIKLEDS